MRVLISCEQSQRMLGRLETNYMKSSENGYLFIVFLIDKKLHDK